MNGELQELVKQRDALYAAVKGLEHLFERNLDWREAKACEDAIMLVESSKLNVLNDVSERSE